MRLNNLELCLKDLVPAVLKSATTSTPTLIACFYVSKEEKLTKKFYTFTRSMYYLL